jgi:hypothetical protein
MFCIRGFALIGLFIHTILGLPMTADVVLMPAAVLRFAVTGTPTKKSSKIDFADCSTW